MIKMNHILAFPTQPRETLVCTWIATGNPARPLACRWVLRSANCNHQPTTQAAMPPGHRRCA
jgi:hypothetical protein